MMIDLVIIVICFLFVLLVVVPSRRPSIKQIDESTARRVARLAPYRSERMDYLHTTFNKLYAFHDRSLFIPKYLEVPSKDFEEIKKWSNQIQRTIAQADPNYQFHDEPWIFGVIVITNKDAKEMRLLRYRPIDIPGPLCLD